MHTKNTSLIMVSLLTVFLQLFAQTFAFGQTIAQGKTWHIESGYACAEGYETGCFCYYGIETIKVGNTKTFNGKEYYELLSNIPNQQWNIVTYVREEDKKVFFYAEECDKEYVMYDFNLNVGDEIFLIDPRSPTSHYNHDNPCELTEADSSLYQFKVTEVDSIEYNRVKRKRLRLESHYPHRYDIWVEGIGCMRGITYHRAQQITGAHQLKDCYESDELIFTNENPEFCWVQLSAVNDVRQDLITVFTDENNILHIFNANNISLDIYNVQGQKMHAILLKSDNYETDISFLPRGLYVISNQMKNINFKIVVK